MIGAALGDIQARRENARAQSAAQQQADDERKQRYYTALMSKLSRDELGQLLAANPDLSSGINYPQFQKTPQELEADAWSRESTEAAGKYDPDKFEVSNVGYNKITGNAPSADFTKTIAGREYMSRPDDFGQSLRVGGNIELGATGLEEKRQADRKFLEIERPESRSRVNLTGAQTGEVNARTGLVGAQTGNVILQRNKNSPLSPGYVKPAAAAAAADPTEGPRQVLAVLDILDKHPGMSGAIGAKGPMSAFGYMDKPIGGSDAAGYVSQVDRLKSLITIPQLKNMKGLGAMSDKEFSTMQASAAALSRDMPESDFRKELARIREVMASVLAKSGGAPAGGTNSLGFTPPK